MLKCCVLFQDVFLRELSMYSTWVLFQDTFLQETGCSIFTWSSKPLGKSNRLRDTEGNRGIQNHVNDKRNHVYCSSYLLRHQHTHSNFIHNNCFGQFWSVHILIWYMNLKFAVNVIVNLSNCILIYLKIVTVGVALACAAGGINVGVLHWFGSRKSLAASPLASRAGAAKEIPRAQESRQLCRFGPGYFNPWIPALRTSTLPSELIYVLPNCSCFSVGCSVDPSNRCQTSAWFSPRRV